MAIKNLKAIGALFDEYDIEIEADRIKTEQDAVLHKEQNNVHE